MTKHNSLDPAVRMLPWLAGNLLRASEMAGRQQSPQEVPQMHGALREIYAELQTASVLLATALQTDRPAARLTVGTTLVQ